MQVILEICKSLQFQNKDLLIEERKNVLFLWNNVKNRDKKYLFFFFFKNLFIITNREKASQLFKTKNREECQRNHKQVGCLQKNQDIFPLVQNIMIIYIASHFLWMRDLVRVIMWRGNICTLYIGRDVCVDLDWVMSQLLTQSAAASFY